MKNSNYTTVINIVTVRLLALFWCDRHWRNVPSSPSSARRLSHVTPRGGCFLLTRTCRQHPTSMQVLDASLNVWFFFLLTLLRSCTSQRFLTTKFLNVRHGYCLNTSSESRAWFCPRWLSSQWDVEVCGCDYASYFAESRVWISRWWIGPGQSWIPLPISNWNSSRLIDLINGSRRRPEYELMYASWHLQELLIQIIFKLKQFYGFPFFNSFDSEHLILAPNLKPIVTICVTIESNFLTYYVLITETYSWSGFSCESCVTW